VTSSGKGAMKHCPFSLTSRCAWYSVTTREISISNNLTCILARHCKK
jgi:hypothetical protein